MDTDFFERYVSNMNGIMPKKKEKDEGPSEEYPRLPPCRSCGYPKRQFSGYYWATPYCWICAERRYDPLFDFLQKPKD